MDKKERNEMKEEYRKAVFVVVYSRHNNKIEYLVLKRKLHWRGWEFPKEGIEKDEKEEYAVRRGVREETGLNITGPIKKFDIHGKYKFSKKLPDRPGFIGQTYSLYAVEVNKGKIKLDRHEHSASEWLEFKDAFNRITQKNQKGCLEVVNSFLRHKNFRRIIAKSGALILGGKDEDSNEDLVKQVEPNEYVFHTAAAGSPFVNIKGEANSDDIKEAAIFCARYSRDWKQHKRDVEVNMFRGKDLYKKAGMKPGTFGVKSFKTIKVKKEDIEK
jgi:ADP-ribose pyrophosphatase YjhB (NUDIX family)